MTHPSPEELIGFLYDDLDPARRPAVCEHLATCDVCRTRVESWGVVRRDLAAWELPEPRGRVVSGLAAARPWPVFRWAAAAAVLIATGYGLARMNAARPAAPAPDITALRAQITGELRVALRDELRGELAADQARIAADQAAERETFRQAVARALDALENRQAADLAELRADVETVALRAQTELSQLAVSSQPDSKIIPEQR
jgi:hypothetical protein